MKNSLLIIILILALCDAKGNAHALLIGVGDYPESTGWNTLASSNDILYVRTALLSIGFHDRNIVTLRDREADRNGILHALDHMANTINQGDLLIVHFSGHGQQVVDRNGDEVDGYDEAWVPYDARKEYIKGSYEGEKHIIDDEVASYDLLFRKRLGTNGKLIWVIDACHSGTSTRTTNKYTRGTERIMGETMISNHLKAEENLGMINAKRIDVSVAPVACFSASSSSQSNQECKDDLGQPIGSLSFAFAKTISEGYASHSMIDIYNRIKIRMLRNVPLQSPQFEGNGDFAIKENSDTSEVMQLYNVSKLSNQNCQIDGGFLQGVTENSNVEIYSLDRKVKLGSGTIQSVSISTATVVLSDPIKMVGDELLKAKIVSRAPSSPSLVTDYQSRGLFPSIESFFDDISYNKVSDCNADITIVENADKSISMYDKYGMDYLNDHKVSSMSETMDLIKNIVKQIAFAEYIRDYENVISGMDIDLQVFDQSDNLVDEGSSLSSGDKVRFELSNNGNRRLYFGFVGISPNGDIYVIRPGERDYVLDQFVDSGASIALTPLSDIAPPLGMEIVKVFVSHKPISWIRDVFVAGSIEEDRSGDLNPFQNALSILNETESGSRSTNNNTALSVIGAKSFHFKIVN